jgi:hypothetical protein
VKKGQLLECVGFGLLSGLLIGCMALIPKEQFPRWINHTVLDVFLYLFAVILAGRIRAILRACYDSLQNTPPSNGRFLIMLFMPNIAGDALLGDLEERFHIIARDPDLGLRRAHFWYWFQVFLSLRPLVWAGIKRLTGLAALWEAIRKTVG